MPRRIAQSVLNASTIDIMNVIRQNASYDYQQSVPEVVQATDIPRVGEVIYGTPAFANQFINALVNRIAAVRVQSATFNNPYSILKKGYIEFGESIEEIFVNIAKAVDFNPEKAPAREFKRSIPDIRSAFHVMNWRVMYPVTIQDEDLRQAFLSLDGVQNLIAKIVDSVYTAAEYDEFLLFKYMLIKSASHGKIKVLATGSAAAETPKDAMEALAVSYRAASNLLPFMSDEYNAEGVLTNTPKSRQVIFMDARLNALFDVNVLASAFNMDKADFMGRVFLIDNWTSFDNKRFEVIRANSDGIEPVTEDELSIMQSVGAMLIDENWFQVYDNNNKFTEKYVASGLYWNYFYHTWKTVSWSPFANAVCFVENTQASLESPAQLTLTVDSKEDSETAMVYTFSLANESEVPSGSNINFIQTEALAKAGIAVQRYGALIIPASKTGTDITLVAELNGARYTATAPISMSTAVAESITLKKDVASGS